MGYYIETIEDLERILKENVEWREKIRRVLWEEDLLKLPQRFEKFVEEEFRPLAQRVERLEERQRKLEEGQRRLEEGQREAKERMDRFEERMDYFERELNELKRIVGILNVQVAELRGDNFERKIRERAPSYFGRIVRRLKPIDAYAFANLLDDAYEEGKISWEEREEVLNLDFVGFGRYVKTGEEIYLAVEVSLSLYPEDVKKAKKRGDILKKVVDARVLPIVVYETEGEGVAELADHSGVLAIKAKRTTPTQEQA